MLVSVQYGPRSPRVPTHPAARPGRVGRRPTASGPGSAGPGGATESAGKSKTGLVNVNGNDETEEIYVDGAFVGNMPAKLKLAEGAHVIEVKKAGFKEYRKEVRVGEGSELTLRVILDKQ